MFLSALWLGKLQSFSAHWKNYFSALSLQKKTAAQI